MSTITQCVNTYLATGAVAGRDLAAGIERGSDFKVTNCDLNSVHHWVSEGLVGPNAQGEGADGGAGVVLLVLS